MTFYESIKLETLLNHIVSTYDVSLSTAKQVVNTLKQRKLIFVENENITCVNNSGNSCKLTVTSEVVSKNLKKMIGKNFPRKLETLLNHIVSTHKVSLSTANQIVDTLKQQKFIFVENGNITCLNNSKLPENSKIVYENLKKIKKDKRPKKIKTLINYIMSCQNIDSNQARNIFNILNNYGIVIIESNKINYNY